MENVKILLLIIIGVVSMSHGAINGVNAQNRHKVISLESLLEEMVSFDEVTDYPSPAYLSQQVSSYDRQSVAPHLPGWFANGDGHGFIRLDTLQGRVEKVLFDEKDPGVITRIWITTSMKQGILRFYFDGEYTPRLEIPAYDMSKTPFYVGEALSMIHTNYKEDMNGRGGNTFMLPLPYSKSCKITFEEPDYTKRIPRYYHVNYRKYTDAVAIKTFSVNEVKRLRDKLREINTILLNPPTSLSGVKTEVWGQGLETGKTFSLNLPNGEHVVRTLIIEVKSGKGDYAKMMRSLLLSMRFDGKETVWAPLSDFSGAGFGAAKVDSWFMSADGKGKIISRWLMPYKEQAEIKIKNLFDFPVNLKIETYSSPMVWSPERLYFHCSWKQERGIPLSKWNEPSGEVDWNFATINGKGIYRGDLLTLYNYAPDWYGEGDEKIYVDDEIFPSTFGTGTEDYYNCSWAPVVPFHTPFGGAPRADNSSSYGFNSYFRTRNLDLIPFTKKLRFDIEMLSWNKGTADYATTVYWYGDYAATIEKGEKATETELLQKMPGCY